MHDTTASEHDGWTIDQRSFLTADAELLVERIERVQRAADELAAACAPLWDEYRESCRSAIAATFAELDMAWCGHRDPISAALRQRVLERDEYRCVECGSIEGLQLDHVKPVVKGGTNDERNLQTLCGPCNARKGAR